METKIVSLNEIRKCPKYILSPSHWIPRHKIEECHNNLIEMVEKKKQELKIRVEKEERKVEKELKSFKESLRI